MIISLCGFMGAGKSTLGKAIAVKTGYKFIDLDHYIEDKYATTISNIFTKLGEEAFREKEREALEEIIAEHNYLNSKGAYNVILSLGGGTVTSSPSARLVAGNTRCVYLKCSKEILLQRLLKNNSKRPLVAGKDTQELSNTIDTLMEKREKLYIESASIVFNANNGKADAVAEKLMETLDLKKL